MRERNEKKRRRKADYLKAVESYRKRMIEHPTKAEQKLKDALGVVGIEFEFQKIITGKLWKEKKLSIVDFYLPEIKTVVEVDGGYHVEFKQTQQDYIRTVRIWSGSGIKHFLRFTNDDIFQRCGTLVLPKIIGIINVERKAKEEYQKMRSAVKKGFEYHAPVLSKGNKWNPIRVWHNPDVKVFTDKDQTQEQLRALVPSEMARA